MLTSEIEVRKLCDAIATRRARSIVELIQRGTVGLAGAVQRTHSAPQFESLASIRQRAETYWSSSEGALPYLETFFAPEHPLGLKGAALSEVLRSATIPIQNRYPFTDVSTSQVETPTAWGWLGIIPFHEEPSAEHPPTYLWLLERSGAFLYREKLWEDGREHLKGTVGIFHVIGKLVLQLRFLDRLMRRLEIAETNRFRVGIAINHVKGRYLTNENMGFRDDYTGTREPRVEVFLDATLGEVRRAREDFALNLLEEVVWQFRRQDWSRQDLVRMLNLVPRTIGREYEFPESET